MLLAAVPHLVKDINLIPTRPAGHIENITPVKNVNTGLDVVFFTAIDPASGTELWISDGTADGTHIVKDICSGPDSSSPSSLTNVNGTLFFAANDGVHGTELWKSDGTALGTVMVENIRVPMPTEQDPNPPELGSNPVNLTNINGVLYFQANDGIHGAEPWTSTGTAAGTSMLTDINQATVNEVAQGSNPSNFTYSEIFGFVIFRATTPDFGSELYYTDGSPDSAAQLLDINPGPASSVNTRFLMINDGTGTIYFTANDGLHGIELWKTLGTPDTTQLVHDILPGIGSGIPSGASMVASNGLVYFTASDGVNGVELWVSNGTPDDDPDLPPDPNPNTYMLKDINPGSLSSSPASLTVVHNVSGDTVFFAANDGAVYVDNGDDPNAPDEHGTELWKTDGTQSGTVLVKNIRLDPAPTENNPTPATLSSGPANLFAWNGLLYFSANDSDDDSSNGSNHGVELWVSDGTAEGTELLKDIRPQPSPLDHHPASADSSPQLFAAANGLLFFQANDGTHGGELWTTDGTTDNTLLVKDIYLGTDNLSIDSTPSRFAKINGVLYFTGTWGNGSIGLFKSDGTSDGTELLYDFYPATTANPPQNLTAIGTKLFFSAYDPVHGTELWVHDTLSGTTQILANIRPEDLPTEQVPNPPPLSSSPGNFFNFNGQLLFSANDGTTGTELWTSDGTVNGTLPIKDINPNANSSAPSQFVLMGDKVYFVANDGTHGYELWVTDGAAGGNGTHIVTDINGGLSNGLDSTQAWLTPVNGSLYFRANDGSHGSELWLSDGTSAGTKLIEDIYPGTTSSAPSFLTVLDGIVFYYANDGIHGNELWSSNGLIDADSPDPVNWYNSGGNKMVMDINTTDAANPPNGTTLGSSDSSTFQIAFGDKIIFTANDGVHGTELWTVDNNNPPQLLTTINPSTSATVATYFSRPTIYNGALYFVVDDGVHNRELWTTDGTAAGTKIVYDLRPGTVGSFDNQSPMMVVGNNLFFIANDGLHGAELWKYNNMDATAPTITNGTYDFDHGTIVLQFSEDVSASLTPDDLKIQWVLPTGTTFSPTDMTWDPLTNTATFSYHPTDAYPSIWPDGNFKLTILTTDVTDETGNPLSSNFSLDFWVLTGDANRDRKVDSADLGILSANWQGSGKVFSQGDFDYDGDVDLIDLYLLSRNRGVTLAVPPPAAAPVAAKRTPARTPIRATIDSLK